ncbi:MAG: AAA family ATPase, partial [Candidatus Obscuribacterales bacterium]|nr:AAA family ATPase [Candidatus Obscuribacterales bacterium]
MNKQRIAIAITVFIIASWLYFIWVGTKGPSVEGYKPADNPAITINYSDLKHRLFAEPKLVNRVIVEKDALGQPTAIVLLMIRSTGIDDIKAELPSKEVEAEIRAFAEKHEIEYAAERQPLPKENESGLGSTLLGFLPQIIMILFFGAIVYFMWKQYQNMNGNSKNNMRKSKFQLIEKGKVNVCFDDVEGCPEAKEELKDIVDYLKDPSQLEKLGGKVTKGVLLIGPPGTGKTLIARAIAGEAQVAFLSGGGSGFIEMYVGLGAARVRDLFAEAKKHKPCIIFIDEIDSVGRARSSGGNAGDSEQDQTLNQILQEMDGFEGREGIIVIAATNRVDILDKAILRPGRFDLHVTMPLPDINGRENIFKVHTRNKPLEKGINGNLIAKQTFGYSGADIAGMVNQGALVAARRIRNEKAKLIGAGLSDDEIENAVPFVITMEDLSEGADRVKMGIRSDSRKLAISRQEMINTAVHELGHAIVGEYHYRRGLGGDPVVKITIIARSQALGVTMSHPEIDRVSWTKENLLARIRMAFAGRIAQVSILNTIDGGAT